MNESRSPTFRASVGALITNQSNKVLALERKDVPGSWQFPQGGVLVGETELEAVKREIREETGITEKLEQLPREPLLVYELPPKFQSAKTGRGQVLHWFHFRFEGPDDSITLGDKVEFRDWKWITMKELIPSIIWFKRSMYERLAVEFDLYTDLPFEVRNILVAKKRVDDDKVKKAWETVGSILDTQRQAGNLDYREFDLSRHDQRLVDVVESFDADIVVVLGGDGSMLKVLRELDGIELQVIGVNCGILGFLADVEPGQFHKHIVEILHSVSPPDRQIQLSCEIQNYEMSKFNAVNEIVISSKSIIDVELTIKHADAENEFKVTTFRGDGVMIATPIGSTAYNLAAGGPILSQSITDVVVITPICPHTFSSRPLVNSARHIYRLKLLSPEAEVQIDGSSCCNLKKGETVEVKLSDRHSYLRRLKNHDLYKVLRSKLNWMA